MNVKSLQSKFKSNAINLLIYRKHNQ